MEENFLRIDAAFSALIMTLFVYATPFEISTRLFELFLIEGESVLVRVICKMVKIKQEKILALEDMHLQKFIH